MSAFILLGAVAIVIGIALLTPAIRRRGEGQPRHAAMLIGGMMLTAFGLFLAGFAIASQNAAGAR
ncbi:hypothetical protein [Sphingomonas sp. URHD0057]|uniref:hypothetical protein n=1 Tax=Sphingomonas sp. URHD0057 TaxID=1380389 RepID=UPI00048E3C45|nr:hypothetical protein [Sphingomonas sp. URHD0057]